MISIPCLCKYMATWVGKLTMHGPMGRARARGPGPAAGVGGGWGDGGGQPAMVNLPTHVAMYLHKQGMEII